MFIRKVCAGSQSSLALTSTGQVGPPSGVTTAQQRARCADGSRLAPQVYAWGCGACLGCGSSEATALRPKLIEELATTRVVDISIGDSHCLALSHGRVSPLLSVPLDPLRELTRSSVQKNTVPLTEIGVKHLSPVNKGVSMEGGVPQSSSSVSDESMVAS